MSRRVATAFVLAALLSCAGPRETSTPPPTGPETVVLLLAEPDGTVGRVEVATAGGSTTLDGAGEATRATSAHEAPTEPEVLSPEQIDALFGAALAARPEPPVRFWLYFKQDSAELTAASNEQLGEVVAAIRDRASFDVSVVGHTDTLGEKRHNYELSLDRARSVGALLVRAGVDETTIVITSHGEENLLVPTADEVAEPRNRRVEITVR